MRLLVLAIAFLVVCCGSLGVSATDAGSIPASFVITDTPSASVGSNGAATDELKFVKQWQISADAGGEITAISALVLDLPGQVFISYGKKPSSASVSLLGDIKVYARSQALSDAVTVASKRAMKGSKLILSSSSGNATSSSNDAVLTEVVLFRKTALKKLITNGAADVVVTNDIFFTKKKEDAWDFTTRSLRAASSAAVSIQDLPSQNSRSSVTSSPGQSNWAITTTSGSVYDPVVLDIQVSGDFPSIYLKRIDSDLLPEGSIGMLSAINGTIQVNGTQAGDAQDTLHIDSLNKSAWATIYLSPVVEIKSSTKNSSAASGCIDMNDFNTTLLDEALVVLVNGTGNLFVPASDSAVYVDDAEFRVAGSGFIQALFKVILTPTGVRVMDHDFGGMTGYRSHVTAFFLGGPKVCMTSVDYGTTIGTIGTFGDKADPLAPCPVYAVPKKSGRASYSQDIQAPSSSAAAGVGLALWSSGLALAVAVLSIRKIVELDREQPRIIKNIRVINDGTSGSRLSCFANVVSRRYFLLNGLERLRAR